MIDPRSLTADDAGRSVVWLRENIKPMEGEIATWDERYIWVRVGLDLPMPVDPEYLEWAVADDEVEVT